jgi:hypothetical protein
LRGTLGHGSDDDELAGLSMSGAALTGVSEEEVIRMLGDIKWFSSMTHTQLRTLYSCGKHVSSLPPPASHPCELARRRRHPRRSPVRGRCT